LSTWLDEPQQTPYSGIPEYRSEGVNAVIAACELPIPRGKQLKNRIKTFCGNPQLVLGVDELATKLDKECVEVISSMQGRKPTICNGSELLAHYSDQYRCSEERNTAVVRDNERPGDLRVYMEGGMLYVGGYKLDATARGCDNALQRIAVALRRSRSCHGEQ
jgi:hypothetical protein